GDPGRLPSGGTADIGLSVWFLRWAPFAIAHGLNPFFSSWINAPFGANLAQNTPMPLLGLITAPLTLLVSPISSFNLLAYLAFPLSAFSMFYVVKKLSRSSLAAFVAGLLYGFSPYIVGQGQVHIMLSFIPLPPLILLTLWGILRQKKKPILLGALLGLEVVAQFMIEPEVLALFAVSILPALIVLAIWKRKLINTKRLIYFGKSLTTTAIISFVILIYPIYFMANGQNHFTGTTYPLNNPYRSDLAGLVLPTTNQFLVPHAFKTFALHVGGGDTPEIGDYVGIPLLLFVAVGTFYFRKNRWLVIASFSTFFAWLLSAGPSLTIYNHPTNIPLPFNLIAKLPLIDNILPARFSLMEWLFLSLTVALIIVELKKHLPHSKHKKVLAIVLSTWALAIVITLLPSWPYSSSQQVGDIKLPQTNSTQAPVALTYPYPLYPFDQAMVWQAANNMSFKIVGAYIENPNAAGIQSVFTPLLNPPAMQQWLAYEENVTYAPWTDSKTITNNDITSFMNLNHINKVIVDQKAPNSINVVKRFSQVLGTPTHTGQYFVWSVSSN
ncbi:MAG TPA: hypothetical protein VGF75_03050, partial [Candidatus Saccharimonadales bacterium]